MLYDLSIIACITMLEFIETDRIILKVIIVHLLLLGTLNLSAQVFENRAKNNGDTTNLKKPLFNAYYPKIQYEHGRYNNISIGVGFVNVFTDFVIWRTNGPFIDVGLNFKDNQALLSNKIGFEYYYLVLAARANLVNTTDFNYNQICFRPEVGLTLFTKLTVMYGYNVNLNDEDYFDLKGSVLSINLGIL